MLIPTLHYCFLQGIAVANSFEGVQRKDTGCASVRVQVRSIVSAEHGP